ncbi:TIGR02206 family membrane protein [Mycobacterium sp. GA-1199]|uniref:YwaF family protein n=1 Tax=Mycobacterium sp. GA-1199 TaxID=1772287 RepID=UPI0012E36405|nr:TIGR02206 family membrane protein [Mycobacterium sp. GA-1199]
MLLARQFEPYGPSYWGAIAVFVAGAVVLVWAGHRQTDAQAQRWGRALGGLTALIYGAVLVYNLVPPTLAGSVPLQLTDLATVVAAYALWSRRQWAYALTYYWGLVLSVQALISPVLRGPDFPHYRFLAFYAIHLLVVWAAIYLTWGRGMHPDWRDYRLAVAVTSVWAVVTVVFNRIADTNYGFTNYKPDTASALDILGPWPVYIVVTAALVFAVWALMTWPWVRR